jgi:anti-anti-sigma factor
VEFSSQRLTSVVSAAPKGRIDQSTAGAFEHALTAVLDDLDARPAALLLDFSGVDYISSVGLRVVMMAARRMQARGARLAVAGLQPLVREIFEISRFHLIVEVFATPSEALQALDARDAGEAVGQQLPS